MNPRIVACFLLALVSTAAWPDEKAASKATLAGRVVDSQGEGIPGVLLTLTNPALSVAPTTGRTDVEGQFSFEGLTPGDGYEVEASVPDYARVVAGPLRLNPASLTRIVLTLEASSALEETVRVEARGAIVDLDTTSTGVTYSSEFIEGLPLVGRQFEDILTLTPGVTDADGDGTPNVHGARETSFQLRLDGTNVNNPLTGMIGQNVNIESIEEVELVTTGASAEYGGASGGFANVITRSGGNDFSGSLKLFYRSDFLDGDGANDLEPPEFTVNNVFLTLGGPFVRDKLWYFASVEGLDEEIPVIFAAGGHAIQAAIEEREGWRAFGKLTWQANLENRLALQINYDPIELTGNNIGPFTSEETDFRLSTGGPIVQLTWSAVLSPQLLLQTIFSHMDGRLVTQPLSPNYRDIDVSIFTIINDERRVANPCSRLNCFEDENFRRFAADPVFGRGREAIFLDLGPWNERGTEDLDRSTMRSDLAYTVEDVGGQHTLKTGFEANVETYEEQAVFNPIVTDQTCAFDFCPTPGVDVNAVPNDARVGTLLMDVFDPGQIDASAEGTFVGAWAQDSWKPRPGLAINVGVRFDNEQIDSSGKTHIEPVEELEEALAIWDLWCDAAGHGCTSTHKAGRFDGAMPFTFAPPAGHPALVYDLNGDGKLEQAGAEGAQIRAPFTTHDEWLDEPLELNNSNVAPRFSISWDPWEDGRTKFFGSYGVFYDRTYLGAVTQGQLPERVTAKWNLSVSNVFTRFGPVLTVIQAPPGATSERLFGPAINQVDPDLQTPYTVEWTAGFEREIAPEWSVGLTYIKRRGEDLLQDTDINHITCDQFDEALGVDPYAICGDGGGGFLEMDKFGAYSGANKVPNGALDLYVHNPNFNQILEVGNVNVSDYTAWELILRKRLHRNWQMLFGYTYSKAHGEAETFDSLTGNDAAVSDRSSGYLDFDQRHVVKWQALTHLPRGLLIGGTIEWASGLPYSFIGLVEGDYDDFGNITTQRVFSVTGEKNDQRNGSVLTVNGRIEKRFTLGQVQVSAFVEGENLLDENDLRLLQVDTGDRDVDGGGGAADRTTAIITDGTRKYGRLWEIGASFFF